MSLFAILVSSGLIGCAATCETASKAINRDKGARQELKEGIKEYLRTPEGRELLREIVEQHAPDIVPAVMPAAQDWTVEQLKQYLRQKAIQGGAGCAEIIQQLGQGLWTRALSANSSGAGGPQLECYADEDTRDTLVGMLAEGVCSAQCRKNLTSSVGGGVEGMGPMANITLNTAAVQSSLESAIDCGFRNMDGDLNLPRAALSTAE